MNQPCNNFGFPRENRLIFFDVLGAAFEAGKSALETGAEVAKQTTDVAQEAIDKATSSETLNQAAETLSSKGIEQAGSLASKAGVRIERIDNLVQGVQAEGLQLFENFKQVKSPGEAIDIGTRGAKEGVKTTGEVAKVITGTLGAGIGERAREQADSMIDSTTQNVERGIDQAGEVARVITELDATTLSKYIQEGALKNAPEAVQQFMKNAELYEQTIKTITDGTPDQFKKYIEMLQAKTTWKIPEKFLKAPSQEDINQCLQQTEVFLRKSIRSVLMQDPAMKRKFWLADRAKRVEVGDQVALQELSDWYLNKSGQSTWKERTGAAIGKKLAPDQYQHTVREKVIERYEQEMINTEKETGIPRFLIEKIALDPDNTHFYKN